MAMNVIPLRPAPWLLRRHAQDLYIGPDGERVEWDEEDKWRFIERTGPVVAGYETAEEAAEDNGYRLGPWESRLI